jgi:hypothetical protein
MKPILHQTETKKNYRAIFLNNLNVHALDIILANTIQQHTKKITCHDQADSFPGMMQVWFKVYKP